MSYTSFSSLARLSLAKSGKWISSLAFVGGAMVVGLVLTTTQRGMNAAPTSASVEEEAPPEE